MLRCVLLSVAVGLSGPQCPSETRSTTPTPPDVAAAATDDTPAPSSPGPADATEAAQDDAAADAVDAVDAGEETPVDRLRRAREAFRAGRWAEADDLYRESLGAWPALDETIRFHAMEAAYRAGRLEAAGADAASLAAAGGPHAKEAAVRVGDVAYDQERWAEAAAAYGPLDGERLPRGVSEAALRFRLARCLEHLERKAGAQALYEVLVRREPEAEVSAEAEARLREIDPEFAVSPTWRLERARRLVRVREWARAIDELALIPPGTESPRPADVAWERAQALYRHRRRYDEAERAFAVVVEMGGSHAEEAAFLRARSLARDHRDDEAIAAYRAFAEKYRRSGRAVDARYLAATLDLHHGRYDAAIEALEGLVGRDRDGPGRLDSRWSLAMAYLLAERPADALELIDGTLDDDDQSLIRGRALYWGGVARLGLDRKDDAAAKFRAVIDEYPLHWYALLARGRLAQMGEEVPPPYPERTVGRSAMGADCGGLPEEVDILRRAGLLDDARARLLAAEGSLVADATGAQLQGLLARFLCVGATDVVHRHVVGAHSSRWGLKLDADDLPFWEGAYPKGWREQVEAAAAREGTSPYLIWAIMRQESSFDPDVVSYADAIGLLQMIPPTTTRMLQARGEAYDDTLLYDPERNIALGVEYIAWIQRKFHGQLPPTMGGYNGGPHNVARWFDETGETRLDYFVERIPFGQTRNYVRRVTTAYARYLFLYETDENAWPLTLDFTLRPDYLPDPDF